MIAKVVFAVCIQAVIFQSISAQCYGSLPTISAPNCGCSGSNVGYIAAPSCGCSGSNAGYISGYSADYNSGSNYGYSRTTTAGTGGPLTVTCYGPLSTNGISVLAELCMDGQLQVTGSLPFLSAVALEGTLPTSGVATVSYGCGDGNVVILQEAGNPSGNNAASSSGLTLANLGGCGCRSY